MDIQRIAIGLWLSFGPFVALQGSDFYLVRVGPSPLRFTPPPAKGSGYVWPIPRNPAVASTNAPTLISAATVATTANAEVKPEPTATQTNSLVLPQVSEAGVSSQANTSQIPVGADGKPLSASNLLIVTPQMLADYFKSTLDVSKMSTNAPAGGDIPFNPPMPKAPSSEAIYRTQ